MIAKKINKNKNAWAGNLSVWLALFLAFGYPIQASIAIFFHTSSTPINAAFRGVYVFVSLLLIFVALPQRKIISRGAFWLIVFWILYLTRFVIDMSVRDIQYGEKDTLFMYFMVFGNSFLPLTAIVLNSKHIMLDNIYKRLFTIVAASNLVLVLLIIYQQGGISFALFNGRMEITGLTEDEHVINSIVVGLYGNSLFLISTYSLMFLQYESFAKKLFDVFLALLGMFNLLIAASRGPFLSMILLVLLMMFFKFRSAKIKATFLFKTIGVSLLVLFIVLSTGLLNNAVSSFSILNRLEDLNYNIQNGEKETRNFEYRSAIEQFSSNPIFGDRYVTTYDGSYPHNIYLEVLMALGLVGTAVFLLIHFEIYRRVAYIFKTKNHRFFLLLITLLVVLFAAFTSGGIALAPELWMVMALFFAIRYVNKKAITIPAKKTISGITA